MLNEGQRWTWHWIDYDSFNCVEHNFFFDGSCVWLSYDTFFMDIKGNVDNRFYYAVMIREKQSSILIR